jgi:hypothetical protein
MSSVAKYVKEILRDFARRQAAIGPECVKTPLASKALY